MIDEEIQKLMISQNEWDEMCDEKEPQESQSFEWVLGISTAGHGGSICLLRNQQIVFYVKEERFSRLKRDSRVNYKCLYEVKKYTDRIDLLVTANMNQDRLEFISQLTKDGIEIKNQFDPSYSDQSCKNIMASEHHINHASSGYHLSPFNDAITIVMDGWGWIGEARQILPQDFGSIEQVYGSEQDELRFGVRMYDHCTIWKSSPHPNEWKLLYKELSSDYTRNCNFEGDYPDISTIEKDYKDYYNNYVDGAEDAEIHLAQPMSVPVCYESVTCFLGFHQEDVGKTMGLSCYGKPNDEIPSFLIDNEWKDTSDLVAGNILLNTVIHPQLQKYHPDEPASFQQRADIAYAIQKDLEKKVICVVERAMRMSDCKNIVLSGGVFHNVMINELLTSKYPEYTFFADPLCDDAGHSFGAAIWYDKVLSGDIYGNFRPKSMYLGPRIPKDELKERVIDAVNKYNCPVL